MKKALQIMSKFLISKHLMLLTITIRKSTKDNGRYEFDDQQHFFLKVFNNYESEGNKEIIFWAPQLFIFVSSGINLLLPPTDEKRPDW